MRVILYSAIAGIFGTGAGGFISSILMKRSSDKMACWMLSFAAGIMTSVVCFGLVRESIELTNIAVSILGLIIGIIIIMVLNRIVDKHTGAGADGLASVNVKLHQTHEELYHESSIISERDKLLRSGMIMLFAIGLHNFPEGLAIGAGGSHDVQLGLVLAIIIALHNIPEGMAIATPLLAGGISKSMVVLLTALSGAPTLLGGLIGSLLGSISDFAVALSLSTAGGAMLYVVFGEIIPQSVIMVKNRSASIVTLIGIIIGLVVAYV
ncbi:MAG: ZIP family metal transporter [Oscillospiraceae bacterium]|nr:ZIP family metal transporter [Oscillospiraceae bacterium]